MKSEFVKQKVYAFLENCPPDFDYPLGGEVKFPIDGELRFSELFPNGFNLNLTEVIDVFGKLTSGDAYNLAIFSLRMAVYAVESNNTRFLNDNLWALCVDRDILDWRDVLVSLSIAEDCCLRMGCDFQNAIEPYIVFTTERRKRTIIQDYFARTSEMRDVETMGYKGIFEDGRLQYLKLI